MAKAKTSTRKRPSTKVKQAKSNKPAKGAKATKAKRPSRSRGWWQTVATMNNKGRSALHCLKIKHSVKNGTKITMTAKQALFIGQQMLELLTRPEVDVSNPDGVVEMTCYRQGGVTVMGRRKARRSR